MPPNTLKRYQIIREIARSNDIVYEAHDPQTGRRIALKELVIPPGLTGQARRERIERFRREGRAAGALSPHPHIVTIFDVDNEGERFFIAMEYLEGQPLRDILQMEGPMSVERARKLAVQVCDALDYAHARGVIHRDIKPDNIHVLPGDVVKLTDFGIARIAADPSITSDGQVFGTPSYMSPEQIAGKPLDARTDVYSLGVTLYEMLTGRKPFTGDSVVTITYNIMNQEPPPLVGVPPEIQQVVLRAMAKAPEGRFPTAAAMKSALLSARTVTGSLSPVTSPSSRTLMPGAPGPGGPAAPPAQAPRAVAASGPEPTQEDPPPLYIPRRPGAFGQALKRHGQFLSMLTVAVAISLVCVFFIWAGNRSYQNYQMRARETRAASFNDEGFVLHKAGRYAEALAKFQDAVNTAPPGTETHRLARRNAAAACIELGNALLQGRPTQAAEYYRRAVEFAGPSSDVEDAAPRALAHYALGMALHHSNRIAEAVGEWEEVLSLAAATPVPRRPRSTPREEEAYRNLMATAADARHSIAQVYYNQGVTAFNTQDYQAAAAAFDRCIRTDPGSEIARQAEMLRARILEAGLGFGYP